MVKNKKIAIFVNSEFIPSYSGASNRFHYLSRALEQHTSSKVTIIHCDRGWSNPELIKKEPFRTYMINFKIFKDFELIKKILKDEKIQLIQFADLELAIEIGIPLSQELNIPLIFEAHFDACEFAKSLNAPEEEILKVKFLENKFGKYFDKIIALSNDDSSIATNYRIDKKDIVIIPNGVDPEEFKDSCFNPKSKKIIFLGNLFFGINLSSVKNIKSLIYPSLKGLGYNFNIIGDICSSEIKKMEEEDFIFLGKKEKLSEAFNDTFIALAPILSGAGIRIKILTYMNAGIPIITTNEGARGFNKKELLIIEDDLKKYPNLIRSLKKDNQRLLSLSEESRNYISKNFSWKKIAEEVSLVYDEVLSKQKIEKKKAVELIRTLNFEDPAWIKEIIQKNRFNNIPVTPPDQYVIIN